MKRLVRNEHKTLIGTVTDKAAVSFADPITRENFMRWREHWLQVAREWRAELANEGLQLTVAKIDDLIRFEERMGEYYAKKPFGTTSSQARVSE